MSVLYGSCLCGGVKYAIAAALPAAALPLLDVPQGSGGRAPQPRGGQNLRFRVAAGQRADDLLRILTRVPARLLPGQRLADHQWVARSPRARRWPGTGNARHRSGIAPAAACLCCRQGAMVRDHRRSAATPERAARGIARFDHWIRLLNIGLERGKSELSYCLHYFPKLGERRGRVCEATWREDLSRWRSKSTEWRT